MAAQPSELPAILMFVQGILAAIPGIVHVYTYQPVVLKPPHIPAVMQVAAKIAYWTVTCPSTAGVWLTNESRLLTHDVCIKGYAEVVEPGEVSEPAFQTLTSLVDDTLGPVYHLEVPTATKVELIGPFQLPVRCEHRLLSETFLVHYTEGHLRVTERVTLV